MCKCPYCFCLPKSLLNVCSNKDYNSKRTGVMWGVDVSYSKEWKCKNTVK